MPTMTLLPAGAGTTSSGWIPSAGTTYECLDDDNGDTTYVACSTNLDEMIVEYANPHVAEGDIASIDSVRFLSSGRSTNRRSASLMNIYFQAPTAGFGETCSYNAHASSYETINGTSRTTSDGSNAWTYANLNDLEMKCRKIATIEVRLSYLALEVTYTAAVAADNATFFGANF